jgi:hypothetical protein
MNIRRWRRLVSIGMALYAVFLITIPFEHHDLSCELKTPQHCTACTSSVVGSDPNPPTTLDVWALVDAGSAVLDEIVFREILLGVRTTGRSPPAAL